MNRPNRIPPHQIDYMQKNKPTTNPLRLATCTISYSCGQSILLRRGHGRRREGRRGRGGDGARPPVGIQHRRPRHPPAAAAGPGHVVLRQRQAEEGEEEVPQAPELQRGRQEERAQDLVRAQPPPPRARRALAQLRRCARRRRQDRGAEHHSARPVGWDVRCLLRFASLAWSSSFFFRRARFAVCRCRVRRVVLGAGFDFGCVECGRKAARDVRARPWRGCRVAAGRAARGPWSLSLPPPRGLGRFLVCRASCLYALRSCWRDRSSLLLSPSGQGESGRHEVEVAYPFCGHFLVLTVTEFVVARTRDTRGKNLTCCSTLLSDLRWHFRCSGSNRPAREKLWTALFR